MSLFNRKESLPMDIRSEQLSGQRARLAQFAHLVSSGSPDDVLNFGSPIEDSNAQLELSDTGLVDAFRIEVKQGLEQGNPTRIVDAGRAMINTVLQRAHQNRRALGIGVERSLEDEKQAVFDRLLQIHFPEKIRDKKNKKRKAEFDTFPGGAWNALKRTVLCRIINRQVLKNGKLVYDKSTFDDNLLVTKVGITIFNPSAGKDGTLIRWEDTHQLLVVPDAAPWLDPINARVMPWITKKHVSLTFFGFVTITDRLGSHTQVEVPCFRPARLAKKLEAMRQTMVEVTRANAKPTAEARPPLRIGTFTSVLDGDTADRVTALRGTKRYQRLDGSGEVFVQSNISEATHQQAVEKVQRQYPSTWFLEWKRRMQVKVTRARK